MTKFTKKHIPWNKGKVGVYSESTLKKMSELKKGKNIGHPNYNLGHTEETKRKISEASKLHWEDKEYREKIIKQKTGEKNWRWIEDRTKLSRENKQGERRTSAYFEWRKQVWLRDNFKCKIANPDCNGKIEAHHILGWTEYIELRYEINNGITLCHAHHPRKRAEEKRLIPTFQELVSVSKSTF